MRALAVLALMVAAACARDTTGLTDPPVTGIYHLATVNGSPLPLLISSDSSARVDVTESVLTLNEDRTWSEVTSFRVVPSTGATSTPTQMNFGTYTALNGAVELTDAGGFTSHGAVRGTLLTILGDNYSMVYRR